jgi:hypothetical protein
VDYFSNKETDRPERNNMSGRIYLLLAAWGVVSFFMLAALCLAAKRALPIWSRQLRNEAEKQWDAVQSGLAAVPKAMRSLPSLPSPAELLPREVDFQI